MLEMTSQISQLLKRCGSSIQIPVGEMSLIHKERFAVASAASRDDHRAGRLCGTLLLLVRELTEVISSCRRVWHLDSGYRGRWSVSLSSSFLLDGFGCLPGKWVFNLFLWSYHQHMCFVPHSHPRVVSPLKYNLHAICPPTWVCNLCIVTDVYSFVISGMLCKASSSQMALDFSSLPHSTDNAAPA